MKAKILSTIDIKQEWLDEIKEHIPAIEFDIERTKKPLRVIWNSRTKSMYADWFQLRSLFDNGDYRYRVYVMSDVERIAYGMSDHYAAYNVHDKDGVLDFYMSDGANNNVRRLDSKNGFRYTFARRFVHEVGHGKEQEVGRVYLSPTNPDRTHDWEKEGQLKNLLQEHFEISRLQKEVIRLTAILQSLLQRFERIDHPLPSFPISQPYGVPNAVYTMSKHHIGTDYATPVGTPIKMPCDGRIVASKTGANIGHYVTVEFTYKGALYQVRFGHLRETQILRQAKRGEIVAYSGNTGVSTGPHVHCDVWKKKVNLVGINQTNWRDRTIDPEVFFKS